MFFLFLLKKAGFHLHFFIISKIFSFFSTKHCSFLPFPSLSLSPVTLFIAHVLFSIDKHYALPIFFSIDCVLSHKLDHSYVISYSNDIFQFRNLFSLSLSRYLPIYLF